MTDEEMAEEYANNYDIMNKDLSPKSPRHIVKECFLAGLKAGRPQWHDLRKDPNGLPEKYNHCSLSRTVVNQIGTPCHYNYELQCWQNWSYIEIETPIAWCEIPTFDKE